MAHCGGKNSPTLSLVKILHIQISELFKNNKEKNSEQASMWFFRQRWTEAPVVPGRDHMSKGLGPRDCLG
jgi:hypothetical protein